MATVKGGVSTTLMGVSVEAANPAHMTAKPCSYGALGHYSISTATGAMAAGAGADSEVFQFRWTSTTNIAVVTSIRLTGMRATTAFAAGAIDIYVTKAHTWSAAGTGGGTATLTGENQKLRTATMGTTTVGEIRTATTAALGAGTKTFDSQPIGNRILTHSSGGVGSATPIIGSIYLPTLDLFVADVNRGEHPLSLLAVTTNAQGFAIRATVPATGVWNLGFSVSWMETTAY